MIKSGEEVFLTQSISLSCGHPVFMKCLADVEIKEVKCKICNLITKLDFSKLEVVEDIFKYLEKETIVKLNDLKDQIKIKNDISNVTLDYIVEEIDIRIESLIIQVEEAGNKVKEEVKNIRNEILNSNETKLSDYNLSLKELQENIKNKTSLNEEYLDNYQTKLKELNKLIIEIEDSKIPFLKISTQFLDDEDIIGRFYSINRNNLNVQDLLKIENKQYINLEHHPSEFIVLSDTRLLILNYLNDEDTENNQCITIHDENFNLIRKIIKTDITVDGIAINKDKGELYFLHDDKVLVTDFELNFIKYLGSENEDDTYEFSYPSGICFKNGYLYVSDSYNNRIQVFDQNLVFVKSLNLKYEPKEIKASNSILAVASDNGINFYDIKSLDFQKKFDHKLEDGLTLSEIDSYFYAFDYETKEVDCFDQTGDYIETISLNEDDLYDDEDGRIILFNKTLLMNSSSGKKIIRIL